MNKLTIEDKKIIAERVMGWKYKERESYKYFEREIYSNIRIQQWNLDQDLTQFVEMVGALDEVDTWDIERLLIKRYIFKNHVTCFHDLKWLCSHKYEVCKAIIEVIK